MICKLRTDARVEFALPVGQVHHFSIDHLHDHMKLYAKGYAAENYEISMFAFIQTSQKILDTKEPRGI